MNEETQRTSLFLPIVILTAIALALYLLVVWDPIGIYGDVRRYLEHSIRAPLEWIVLLLALSWIIQHDLIYYLFAIVLLPFFLLILWLSSPDGGVWFWRMFTQEIYLPPVYIPRGFLLYVFSLCFALAIMAWWKDPFDRMQKSALLICLTIAFSLTSCEAVFAEPSIAVQYTGSEAGTSYGEQLRNTVQEWWKIFERFIDQHVPYDPKEFDLRSAVKIFVSLYPFMAIVLLLFPGYRRLPKKFLAYVMEEREGLLPLLIFFGAVLGLSSWAWYAAEHGNHPGTGLLVLLGLPAVIFWLALMMTSIVWVPILLLLLPAFLLPIVLLPFKFASFLVVAGIKAPLIIWHYLHYLFVPHPAETAYNAGMARHVPLQELAADVANAMYQYDMRDYDRLPRAWRSRNWQRRIEAFRHRIRAENDFMQELERNIRLREQSSASRR